MPRKITDELPFTTEALRLYIEEGKKELDRLAPMVSLHNKIQARIKKAQERLGSRSNG